jgi:hypothetical protein
MAQLLSHLPEVEAGVEVVDQVEHVALRLARRVPPAAAVLVDDQDLTVAAAVFLGAAGALVLVQSPATQTFRVCGLQSCRR